MLQLIFYVWVDWRKSDFWTISPEVCDQVESIRLLGGKSCVLCFFDLDRFQSININPFVIFLGLRWSHLSRIGILSLSFFYLDQVPQVRVKQVQFCILVKQTGLLCTNVLDLNLSVVKFLDSAFVDNNFGAIRVYFVNLRISGWVFNHQLFQCFRVHGRQGRAFLVEWLQLFLRGILSVAYCGQEGVASLAWHLLHRAH